MKNHSNTFPTVLIDEVPVEQNKVASEQHRPIILVVDDETVIADSLAEILKYSGYAAIPAYDAEDALETALVMPPEVLVSDVMLPKMNGIELGLSVRKIFPDCKVILSSGQPAGARLLTANDAQTCHFLFLHKPVHPRELLQHIANSILPATLPIAAQPA